MKQALHIFAKDARRFLPEILLSLAITLAFVKVYPQTWGAEVSVRLFSWVPEALVALVVVSWLVLIARAMHAETLIGDRQFWVTRPYRWRSLLAAKLLFAFAFVVLPFMVAQCLLLHEAKFHPFSYIPGIVFNTGMAIGIMVLPMMLLASITRNFPKMLLGLLLVVIYTAGLAYISDLMPSNASSPIGSSWWSFVAVLGVMGAVLAFQYATRRTLLTRTLVVAAALLIAVMVLFVSDDADFDKLYAERQGGGVKGVQISVRPTDSEESDGGAFVLENSKEVQLSVPLSVSGIEAKTAIKAEYAKVSIDGPAGQHWESHWQGTDLTWLPGVDQDDVVRLKISRKFYEQMKAVPVTVKLSLAVTKLQEGKVTSMAAPEGEFTMPGGNICSLVAGRFNPMSCRYPLRQPPLMLVATRLSKTACGSAAHIPGETAPSIDWMGTLDNDPAEFGITSVWDTPVVFLPASSASMADSGRFFCAGSTLVFATYTPVERGQTTMSFHANGLQHLSEKMSI